MSVHDVEINKILVAVARGDDLREIESAVDSLLMSQDIAPDDMVDEFAAWLYLAFDGATPMDYRFSCGEPLIFGDITVLRNRVYWSALFSEIRRLPSDVFVAWFQEVRRAVAMRWPIYADLLGSTAEHSVWGAGTRPTPARGDNADSSINSCNAPKRHDWDNLKARAIVEIMKNDGAAVGWSQQKWAGFLNIPKSTLSENALWKYLQTLAYSKKLQKAGIDPGTLRGARKPVN